MSKVHRLLLICIASAVMATASEAAVTVTQTTNAADLGSLVSGTGITLDSATVKNGAASQFAVFSGFNGTVVNLANGVVLSNGVAAETALVGQTPDTALSVPGTPEFDAYGIAHIDNFSRSFDVGALEIAFTLAAPSAVSFEFVFGSTEYPGFVGVYTDAFLAFLDGTGAENQIVFDANNAPVQVGSSFASALTTHDISTVFSNPYGLIGPLATSTGVLAAGRHTILFEVGDTNDGSLDSAVFLSSLSTTTEGGTGPITLPVTPAVPEPGTYRLMVLGLVGVLFLARRRRHRFDRERLPDATEPRGA